MAELEKCEQVRDLLPEMATGVAAGDDRARILTHLARCPACRQELDEMTTVVDELILMAPEREPSSGFETAVLAAVETQPRRSRRTPFVLAAAASIIGALLAGGAVWWQTAADRELAGHYRHTLAVADGKYLVAAQIGSTEEPDAGHAFAYEGHPSWVFMTVDTGPWSGRYRVQLVTTEGRTVDLGWCRVADGHGSWGRSVRVPVHDIAELRLLRPGAATMHARFV
jgi:hypothetical protein